MNEGDSAGGHIGRSPAPPAVTDRRSNTSGSVQMSSGSAVPNPSMSRVSSDRYTQQQQHHQNSNSRINYQQQQPQHNSNNINISSSVVCSSSSLSNSSSSISYIKTQSVSDNSTTSVYKLVTDENTSPKKRLKLSEEQSIVQKKILELKYLRLKRVKEIYSEYVAELFFLQTGGFMMEYPAWRKKPQTPQFVNFLRSNRLDQSLVVATPPPPTTPATVEELDSKTLVVTQQPTTNVNSNLPHGAEIKIPGVGVTPVAVSTTLPAAVAQLSQQGNIPGRPQGGRHGMVFGQIPVPTAIGNSSVPLVPGGTPLVPDVAGVNPTSSAAVNQNSNVGPSVSSTNQSAGSEQFSVKARQEVYVMQRVSELQKEGLWTERRLPKIQETQRVKAHWDYLLEEMVWLAADFASERKWKKIAAKKCARMVQKYFQDKAVAAQKAEKAQELHLKRIASFISKEVKIFWSSVEKLVEYKQHTKLEEKRKKALDQHLSFIVDQTEKFSQQLTEGMNKTVDPNTSGAPSLNSSRISSPKHGVSDDEFNPGNESPDDDEETIAKAEAEQTGVNEEVAALQRESEMDLDDFLRELPKDYLQNRDKINLSESGESDREKEVDEDFKAEENSEDDENTIMEQEKAEKGEDHNKEIEELNAENDMTIEELMKKYSKKTPAGNSDEKMEVDSDDDESTDESEEDKPSDDSDISMNEEESETELTDNEDQIAEFGLKSLLVEEKEKTQDEKDELINDAAALAESIQPKGNTLSSTDVVTPVPFLLKHTLREYQHIGLDWLVTMHDRKLNGILADEMGLGKTIQTIALLAHLACVNGVWGPHLIIVPSSVMLNWEMEFKKWCPGFKILTYYGSQKERKMKRVGWTKPNTFHVCITSYKLVIQDHQSFRRKKWKYLILDEAQNIKNFKSQRWQLLLNFQTEQRLLLTGTPLQNNLMELWSLMHFLMPHVFSSHREFKEWFSNPMTGMIEGNSEYNESIIKRLHKVLRPFLLRRLKSEVEKQMPKKYEHVVMCRLSKRQRYLYDDFMSRAKTRETLASGNLLSVINVLMQLRKVCNHPNLFEIRPTISPFLMEGIEFWAPSLVCNMFNYDPFKQIDLSSLNLILIKLELCLSAYVAHRVKRLATPKKLIEEIDSRPPSPPECPSGKFKLHIRIKDSRVHDSMISRSGVKIGTSPAMKTEGTKLVPVNSVSSPVILATPTMSLTPIPPLTATSTPTQGSPIFNLRKRTDLAGRINVSQSGHVAQIVQTSSGKHILLSSGTTTVVTQSGKRLTVVKNVGQGNRTTQSILGKPVMKVSPLISSTSAQPPIQQQSTISQPLAQAIVQQWRNHSNTTNTSTNNLEIVKVIETEFTLAEKEAMRKERRLHKLQSITRLNQRKCEANPIYGSDLRDSLIKLSTDDKTTEKTSFFCRSYTGCQLTMHSSMDNKYLSNLMKSYEERTGDMKKIFSNFLVFVPHVSAPMIRLHVSHPHPSNLNEEWRRQLIAQKEVSPKLAILHPIISAMNTQFPDPRLIQYDCGKLQTLNKLLRTLKSGQHRVLIFTQMTRMLDVLEAFLNYHGHIYLRLDGTTKIEQRQLLMDRFNGDKRIFVFILSTRSGGVGVNLTGADTVIFYDSDWNPTMDAQAQDRCHRIGQTRDVHIYRLISEKTVEENILKKANQKRLLGDMAIEGGNFTTAYFKSTTIQDIFNVNSGEDDPKARLAEVLDRKTEVASTSTVLVEEKKEAINVFENALAAAEDDVDVDAAKLASAEAVADLAEFDENIPLEDIDGGAVRVEMSKAEQEVENLVKQLSPIERYAMRFVEQTGGSWTAEQLRLAEAEIEQQKREWEANRLAAQKKEEEQKRIDDEENEPVTYSREDSKNQIWISDNTMEKMPMWCPPTPPQDDNDIYQDYSLGFLYEPEVIPESQLPMPYVKKDYKRSRSEAGFYLDGRRPLKVRKEDNYYPPRSLFDRPSPAVAKIRRDLKIQRYRGNFKQSVQLPSLKQQIPPKPLIEPEGMAEWFIYEDMAILNVVQSLQGLPLNLMLLSPGHTPNWDLVADIVNQSSRTFRTPKQCRYRYEAVIVPREEGKLLESPKKQKKNKNPMKISPMKNCRSLRTSMCFSNDNNSAFTKLLKLKFENIKTAYIKKAPQLKQVLVNPSLRNPKHAAVLAEFGISNYENPPAPTDIAQRRVERFAKEKQKQSLPVQTPELIQQQPIIQQQPQQQTIVVQPQAIIQQQGSVTPVVTLVQSNQNQTIHRPSPIVSISQQQQQQIVKAIVANSSAMQQINAPQMGQQQTATVSVVLTTPVTSLSNIHVTGQPQIVSIHQPAIVSTNNMMMTQAQASLVQTVTTQSLPQVVSVSQLGNVGTVITTSTGMHNATVATLTTNALRAQRIVAGPGSLQEVVLNQRPGSQSPTVVSVSGLGQNFTQAQLQSGQLRLSMSGQQVSGVVAKGIPVQGKPGNSAQIQFYRQQPMRQQLKVLHPGQGQGTVVQTSGGQTIVGPGGTIIQGGIVQANVGQTVQVQQAGGQKVAVVSGQNVGTVATVQVGPGQQRTQFIKQVGNKQMARQVSESEVQALMVKRQMINQQQHKGQVIQQGQIFAPANIQVQPGTSNQQIATLVKTSTGGVTTGTVGMTLAQVKGGQIKATMANPQQTRQLHLQQIAIAQQRKGGKMAQITQVGGKAGVPTQLIVQNPNNKMAGTVTVQQIQQVIRHAPPGTITSTGQIVVGKTRVIPVSVASQPNQRQTIQVLTATSAAQAMAAGNIRTHVAGSQLQGTIQGIKVGQSTTPQQQQAILTALQNQHQRQNASPVRLQTSSGSLVAVVQQQQQQSQQHTISVPQQQNNQNIIEVVTPQQQQQIQIQQQHQQQQQQQLHQQQQSQSNQPQQQPPLK